jgi:hypothetical protein
MGNDLCNVSRQAEPVPPAPTQTPQKQRPNITGKPPIHAKKSDNFLPCDCFATPRGRATQEQTARRGFEASLQTPKSKAQGFRNTDTGRQGKPVTNPTNSVPDILVSHIAPRGSSIPPLDLSSDNGSVPPSTDVDGRWIERPADATTPREYAYDPV